MVKVLDESTIDPAMDELEQELTAEEEAVETRRFAPTESPGDLSDGGMVNGARLYPRSGWGGKKVEKGRPAVRLAWTAYGSESLLLLKWNPDGTVNDRGMYYLRKRLCLCCNNAGFHGRRCPECARKGCSLCRGSSDSSKIIPCFYLNPEKVPFPQQLYGDVDCFLPTCPRRGSQGFKDEERMRLHASSRHRMEYRVHRETQQAGKADEVSELRSLVNSLLLAQAAQGHRGAPLPEKVGAAPVGQGRMAKARAAKRTKRPVSE